MKSVLFLFLHIYLSLSCLISFYSNYSSLFYFIFYTEGTTSTGPAGGGKDHSMKYKYKYGEINALPPQLGNGSNISESRELVSSILPLAHTLQPLILIGISPYSTHRQQRERTLRIVLRLPHSSSARYAVWPIMGCVSRGGARGLLRTYISTFLRPTRAIDGWRLWLKW